jgi:hypothetical protein
MWHYFIKENNIGGVCTDLPVLVDLVQEEETLQDKTDSTSFKISEASSW